MEDTTSNPSCILFKEVYLMSGCQTVEVSYDTDDRGNAVKIVIVDSKFYCGITKCKNCGIEITRRTRSEIPTCLDDHYCSPKVHPVDSYALKLLFKANNFI